MLVGSTSVTSELRAGMFADFYVLCVWLGAFVCGSTCAFVLMAHYTTVHSASWREVKPSPLANPVLWLLIRGCGCAV